MLLPSGDFFLEFDSCLINFIGILVTNCYRLYGLEDVQTQTTRLETFLPIDNTNKHEKNPPVKSNVDTSLVVYTMCYDVMCARLALFRRYITKLNSSCSLHLVKSQYLLYVGIEDKVVLITLISLSTE